jgi:hypothetical protein
MGVVWKNTAMLLNGVKGGEAHFVDFRWKAVVFCKPTNN